MHKKILILACGSIYAIGITGCTHPIQTERLTRIEQRLDAVEASLAKFSDDLSRLNLLYGADLLVPQRSNAELQAHIRSLEQKKSELLIDFKPLHPSIRDIDRQIRMLKWQLRAPDGTTTGDTGG